MSEKTDVGGMSSLLSLLRRRPGFRALWLGETVSLIGDWLSYVAVSLLAMHFGEGGLGLALVFAAHVLPVALVSPVAGVVADRVDKRRLLVGTQIAMAALMAAMVLAAAQGSFFWVQVLLFLRTTVAGFFYPAKQAALRELVDDDELVDANAIDPATCSVTFTVGTALGGIVAMAGPVTALVVDGLTFVVAALLLAKLPALPGVAAASKGVRVNELFDALGAASRRRGLLEAVLSKAPLAIAGGGAWVLLNLTADRIGLLGSAALALGALQAVRGVGTGVGPVLSKQLIARGMSSQRLLRLSVWVSFASMAAFTLAAALDLHLIMLFFTALVWGIGGGGSWVFSATEMQQKSPADMLGRLSSVDMLAFTLGQGAGALLAGVAVDATGTPSVAGWSMLVLGIGVYATMRALLQAHRRKAERTSAGGRNPGRTQAA